MVYLINLNQFLNSVPAIYLNLTIYNCVQSPSILIYNKETKQSHMILLSQQETKDHVE
jgi:hypothetical protein